MSDKDLILNITPINSPEELEKAIEKMAKTFQSMSDEIATSKEQYALEHPEQVKCDHGVIFDEDEYKKNPNMPAHEVRKRWPRGWGPCPKGCGFEGIAYGSWLHYIAGDW